MELKPLGLRCRLPVPPVSIGTARLPHDREAAAVLIRRALDAGMRLIDSSRTYDDSELKVALALKNGYRERAVVSAKWSPWAVKVTPADAPTADCARRRIDEQLARLGVDYVDLYLLWLLNTPEQFRQATSKGGLLDGVLRAQDEGLVRHIGFSSHDTPQNICSYMRESDWCEVVMVSFNLINHHNACVLQQAHVLGIGTLVMNPVGGGKFTQPSRVLDALARKTGVSSAAELAIRYIMNNPNADSMLSGIAKHADIDDGVRCVECGPLNVEQMRFVHDMLDSIDEKARHFCTACGYCMPCPQGVDIPGVMACLERQRFWDLSDSARKKYRRLRGKDAAKCTGCGCCLSKCTQHLPVPDEMCAAYRIFGD